MTTDDSSSRGSDERGEQESGDTEVTDTERTGGDRSPVASIAEIVASDDATGPSGAAGNGAPAGEGSGDASEAGATSGADGAGESRGASEPTGTEQIGTVSDPADSTEYDRLSPTVLIVGAGAAGVRAAIELVQQGVPAEELLVIGKRAHGDAHTTWARGGVNGALGSLDPEDSPAIHAADTLNEGLFVNDPAKVERVTNEMPDRLRELDEWGMPFARTEDGEIDQRYFGAQSFRRTAFAGDHTGESMLETLIDRARELGVPYREHVMVTRLLTDEAGVIGAAGYDQDTGRFLLFDSSAVVLAAGGYSALYSRHSSRDDENTGDGPALALEAGASVMDTEFVQFHPTGMAVDESDPEWEPWAGRLVTEAVRGEGGRLFNAEGERFMERYSPKQMELDARDVVARAIAQEISEGRGTENGGVYLDISHRDPEFVRERLPRMVERYESLGVDLAAERVEVAPTAHYGMGGVVVDDDGETDVDGLYAIGETMAGVHGANRLGGNSLAETLAYGRIAGGAIADRLLTATAGDGDDTPEVTPTETVDDPATNGGSPNTDSTDADATDTDATDAGVVNGDSTDELDRQARAHFADLVAMTNRTGSEDAATLVAELRDLLWTHAGILRDGESLSAGLDRLAEIRERAADLDTGPRTETAFETALNLGFGLVVAETILRGALEREESRGAHYRTDATETDPAWRRNVVFQRDPLGVLATSTRKPGEPGPAVQEALDAGYELDYHQLE